MKSLYRLSSLSSTPSPAAARKKRSNLTAAETIIVGSLASEPGISGGDACQRRPVGVAVALRDTGDEVISDEAGHRHWHRLCLGRGERETHVLEAEPQSESSRHEVVTGDHRPIGLVVWRREQCAGQDLKVTVGVDPRFP